MGSIRVEVCSETGICSIIKDSACKVDLLSFEADEIRAAKGDAEVIRKVVAECDSVFAGELDGTDIEDIAAKLV